MALISLALGATITFHLMCFTIAIAEKYGISPSMFLSNISESRINLIIQWLLFVMVICLFHLSEFFVTAIYNPTVVDATSFVVNHSKAYTTAILVS